MKKALTIICIFCLLSTHLYSQKNADFYFQKTKNQIIQEFQYDTSSCVIKVNESDKHINVYFKKTMCAMKFFYNSKDSIELIVFATKDQEIAQNYFNVIDKDYTNQVRDVDYAQWVKAKTIIFYKIQNQSPYPYQFTYILKNEIKKK